jgi:hypothetical protein
MKKVLSLGAVIFAISFSGCYFPGDCIQGYGPVVEEIRDVDDFTAVSNTGSFEVRVSHADSFLVKVEAQENLTALIETYVSGGTLIVRKRNGVCFTSGPRVTVFVSLPELESIEMTGSGSLVADLAVCDDFECTNSGSGYISIDTVNAATAFLKNTGSGKLSAGEIHVDEIEIFQSGSGSVDAGTVFWATGFSINHSSSGRVLSELLGGGDVDAKLTGSGRIELEGDAETADFRLDGSGKIDAIDLETSDVKATITGSGKIYVFANDFLDVLITGSGDLYYRGNPQISQRITGSGTVRPY